MEALLRDLRHTTRMLWGHRGFTAAAVAALALGIGVNTAIFSVVNRVLLEPLPFPEPNRVVLFMNEAPNGSGAGASPAEFRHYRTMSDVVVLASAFRDDVVNLTDGDVPEQLSATRVSADYFELTGAPVIRGRTFSQEEDRPDGTRVAVLSEGLWIRRFNQDPDILGTTIALGGQPHVVIGIIGASFDLEEFGNVPDLWVPFQLDPNSTDQGNYFQVAGRLAPGVTLEQADARLDASATTYREQYPDALPANITLGVERLQEVLVRGARPMLLALTVAVGFVLLIACANVANLLLVRAAGRKREIALRAAIGAGRGRIIRQLLTESVLLSVLGGVLGLGLGVLGIQALLSINTAGLPRLGDAGALVTADWRVVAFTLVMSVTTGVLFGLVPALQSSRVDLNTGLKESVARSGTVIRRNLSRSTLVIVEVALALVLVIGSALLARTLIELRSIDAGFDPGNVLTMRMSLADQRFQSSAAVDQIMRTGVERLERIPAVETASATCCVPLEGGYGLPFVIVGRPLEDGPFHGGGGWLTTAPNFFDVFRIPIARGRAYTERDTGAAPPVVVINEAMARQFWPDSDPLQDRLIIGRGVMAEFADEPERQIIGVVGDVRDAGLNNDPGPRMYIPQAQVTDGANALNVGITPVAWVVRTRGEPYDASTAVQDGLREVTGLPVSQVRSMEDIVSRSISQQRFNVLLMGVFGASALLLAAIGIYGLMAYSTQQRTQEIGIRLALGADRGQVRTMVLMQGMRLALIGVAVGLAAAFGLTRLIASFLFGVEALDPLVFVGAPLVLAAVSLLAVWFPARRASQVQPLAALRYQ
jgi:predicted permease